MSAFGDAMRPLELRHCSSIDQMLAFLRSAWQHASPEERDEFEAYISALAQLKQPGNIGHAFLPPLRIELNFAAYDDEGTELEGDSAELTPKVILTAIAEWREGHDYAPKVGLGFNRT